jgi:DNA-binding HxlR family transcriptional regulator
MSRLLAAFFMGVTRYDDLNVTVGISTNILSDRLRRLTDTKIVERFTTDGRPGYRLTPRGLDLFPAILTVHEWSSRWASGPSGPALLIKHSTCGHTLVPEMACDHCHAALRLDTLTIEAPARWMNLRTGRRTVRTRTPRGRETAR